MRQLRSGDIQVILNEYTDAWIASQHPAERGALHIERTELEHDLAVALARESEQRFAVRPSMFRAVNEVSA